MTQTGLQRRTQLAISLIATALALLLAAPSALAYQTRTPLGSFGPDGTSATSFPRAQEIAFSQANDRLYVLNAFDRFSPATIHAFAAPAHTPVGGAFPISVLNRGENPDIAVDDTPGGSANNIYYSVGELTLGQIFGFSSTGAPLGGKFPIESGFAGWHGLAVNSAGNIWVASEALGQFNKYDSSGNSIGSLTVPQGAPLDLAFDSNDDLYARIASSGIWRYTAANGYKTATQIVPQAALPVGNTTRLALDRTAHTLYVAAGNAVSAYDLAGSLLYRIGGGFYGVAVDESTDQVYVSDGEKVSVFGALADFPDASATLNPPTNVAASSAELNATIDDNSALPTPWRFQLSKDGGASWTDASGANVSGTTPGGQSGLAVSGTAINLQSNTDYRARLVTTKVGSTDVFSNELSFHTELIPAAGGTPNPATNITSTSADLGATIDDNGPLPTAWHFELSKDGGTTWAKPAGNVSGSTAGGQSGIVVSGTATGLEPHTQYRFRIVTKKDPGAPDVASSDLTFLTLSVPPVLSGVGAAQITDTSAYLAGEINPRNLQTSYVFEYGPTPALGTSTPPTDIGSGVDNVVVSRQITGLSPDITYYFKLVATNAAGPAESATLNLHTRATPLPLPEDRAYEQVTPVDKNFGNADYSPNTAVALDGGAVSTCITAGFGDPAAQIRFVCTDYLSRRGAGGWQTRWLGEPVCETEIEESVAGVDTKVSGLSANLDHGVIVHAEGGSCPIPPLDPAAPLPGGNLYLGDYSTDPVGYALLTPQPGFSQQQKYGNHNGDYLAASEDFGHVVYASSGRQTPDAPAGAFEKLFDWHEGALSLVSQDTADTPFATDSIVPENAVNGVSADGSRIFFENPTSGSSQEIYMRQNDAVTYDVSQSECAVSCGAGSADEFRFANPAGNRVLFTTAAKLTNDDASSGGPCSPRATATPGCDLYLYTHSANPAANKNLTLLSKDDEPLDGTGADVRAVLGMSDDGNTVYFVADGQIVVGAPTGPGPKLYRWRSSGGSATVAYLATLESGTADELNWTSSSGASLRPESRVVSPDGAYLLIHTVARLDPAADHDSDEDVYRWDAQGGWACLSCQAPGVPSAGASTFQRGYILRIDTGLRTVMSDDGQRVFFTSHDALAAADANGGAQDVYEWHDGTVSLISSGTGSGNAALLGASRSGDDVFFTTAARLVGWDTDENADVYDARVGGGFPEPPPTGAPCEAEACRGAPTSAPPATSAGTAAFVGPGNPPPPPGCPKAKARRHGRCVSKKHHSKQKHHHRRAAKHDRRSER